MSAKPSKRSGDVALAVADKQRPEAEEGVAPGPKALTSVERAMVRGNERARHGPASVGCLFCAHSKRCQTGHCLRVAKSPDACHRRVIRYRGSTACWLEQLNKIAGRVHEQDLRSAGSDHNVIAKLEAGSS